MSEEDLASKVSTETPWWAKAPVWLAAGIVGVPSLMAIGAGYFIASSVNHRLNVIEQYNLSQLHILNNQNTDLDRRYEVISNLMRLTLEVQIKTCLHEAKTPKEQTECVTMADHLKLLKP